jgi:hypothetical protein
MTRHIREYDEHPLANNSFNPHGLFNMASYGDLNGQIKFFLVKWDGFY